MIEIATQLFDSCPTCHARIGLYYRPYDESDRELSRNYKLFQIVRNKITGFRKQRSVKQLRTYWSACGYVADRTEHKHWNTKDKVDFQCRVGTDFRDTKVLAVRADGEVVFKYRSIAIKNLSHIEACNYFDRAFEHMVAFLDIKPEQRVKIIKGKPKKLTLTAVETLIEKVKENMQGNI